MSERIPDSNYSLSLLREFNIPIETIIDIGVFKGTKPLIEIFPDKLHILFEPLTDFIENIKTNYRYIEHILFNFPLYDKDGEVKLKITVDNNGETLHSRITEENCEKYKILYAQKLDTFLYNITFKKPYLLKLDVDGSELEILKGSVNTLKDCSVVIIEAHPRDYLDRCNFMDQNGFKLFDIVDFCYYDRQLRQFDLIFVKEDILTKYKRNFEKMNKFDGNLWKPYMHMQ
jgi:FkbM family methyltransferase